MTHSYTPRVNWGVICVLPRPHSDFFRDEFFCLILKIFVSLIYGESNRVGNKYQLLNDTYVFFFNVIRL